MAEWRRFSKLIRFEDNGIKTWSQKRKIDFHNKIVNLDFETDLSINDYLNELEKSIDLKTICGFSLGGIHSDPRVYNSVAKKIADLAENYPNIEYFIMGNYEMQDYMYPPYFQICNVLGEIINAIPNLKAILVRGGFHHESRKRIKVFNECLEKLVVQTFGMSSSWVETITRYNLPNLKHLELNLGTKYFGTVENVSSFAPLFRGENFPKLEYLGLKDSDISDSIAYDLSGSPLLKRLKILDLSDGSLMDENAEVLINAVSSHPNIEKLDLSGNGLSEEIEEFTAKVTSKTDLEIDISAQRWLDEDRYGVTRE
jgi:Leucine-rich repeat (LRR) protein